MIVEMISADERLTARQKTRRRVRGVARHL